MLKVKESQIYESENIKVQLRKLKINELGYKYKNRDKEEFMNYVGKLYYMKFRCEEIYERLQQIEKEYIKINKLS